MTPTPSYSYKARWCCSQCQFQEHIYEYSPNKHLIFPTSISSVHSKHYFPHAHMTCFLVNNHHYHFNRPNDLNNDPHGIPHVAVLSVLYTLSENLTDDAVAQLYGTNFQTKSLYLTKLYVTQRFAKASSVTYSKIHQQ